MYIRATIITAVMYLNNLMKTRTTLHKFLLPFIFILLIANWSVAQNLSFSLPVNFLPNARTDKAFDITNFNQGYFVIWKDAAGKSGTPHIAYLGKNYDTAASHPEQTLQGESTYFAPVLRNMGKRIYGIWIATDGSVKYVINNSDSSFDIGHVYTLQLTGNVKLSNGITAAPVNGKMMIASHADNKNDMVFALIDIDENGKLRDAALKTVDKYTSPDYPFVVTLSDTEVRFCWKEKDDNISYADYNINDDKWTGKFSLNDARSKTSPAIYHLLKSPGLFYIWKGQKNDNRIYYASAEKNSAPSKQNVLPGYFSTVNPVAICDVDGNNFIMAYAGSDRKMYLSYFASYNPASWMQDVLFNSKGDYTLKDIVIPGSHDAGMSVLTAAAGLQSQTINECNTLTQTQSIGKQLNAGMRMFDLRIGSYKNVLHTKHCSSDCMAEAVGGGYGEKLHTILTDLKSFLKKNTREIIILNFSHFCEKETPNKDLVDTIVQTLGIDLVYRSAGKNISDVKLNELAGKVVVLFERYVHPGKIVDSSAIADASDAFINWRREYAATNDLNKLASAEERFFTLLKNGVRQNDLIRLDWQLTQSPDEAALICNDFQSDKTSPIINGAMFLTNLIRKNKSIIDLSLKGNNYLPAKVNEWLANGTITKSNKPNVLYVDVAGTWITDYCVDLNNHSVYTR